MENYKEPCICGHIAGLHFLGCTQRHRGISKDGYPAIYKCNCKQFKLDNLSHIEQLAEAKGLV